MASTQKEIILLMQKATSGSNGAVVAQEISAKELHLKAFPHPRGYGMMIIDMDDQFYELQGTQPRKYSSWFINQRVSSSQTVYMANIFDPRFLCLPFLEKAGAKYSPLDQIIHMDEKYARFPFQRVNTWKMQDICDVNDKLGDDMILYRYNESKVIDWLKVKVGRTSTAFMKQRTAKMQNTTFASGFNASKQSTGVAVGSEGSVNTADAPSKEDVVLALEVISDYLAPAMAERLLKAYNMSAADLNSKAAAAANLKRKADWEQELELEKETLAFAAVGTKQGGAPGASGNGGAGSGGSGSAGATSAAGKSAASAVKASVKANQVAAKGTKSIQSFFGGGGGGAAKK